MQSDVLTLMTFNFFVSSQLAMPPELPGDMRLGLTGMAHGGVHGGGLADALSPSQSRSAATSQMLRDYLKRGESKYQPKSDKHR
jgi:hypothetical protein